MTDPYATPEADVLSPESNAIAIRKEHIQHETSVRSIGLLYYLTAILFLVGSIGVFIGDPQESSDASIPVLVIGLVLVIIMVLVGRGLRRLHPKVKIPAIILSVIGLINIPIGTILNAYFLYLYLCKKGSMVFSPEYKDIVKQTPEIKYKTSIIVWIFVALLVLMIIAVIIGAVAGK